MTFSSPQSIFTAATRLDRDAGPAPRSHSERIEPDLKSHLLRSVGDEPVHQGFAAGKVLIVCVAQGTANLHCGAGRATPLAAGHGCALSCGAQDAHVATVGPDSTVLALELTSDFLANLLRDHFPACPHADPGQAPLSQVFRQFSLLPSDLSCLAQLMQADLGVQLSRVFRKAKIYELLSLLLCRLCRPCPSGLTAQDAERLARARQILESDLCSPPSIVDLARQVGINDFKLKKGFKALFGITPYAYVTECRMLAARQRLTLSTLSVTEVANELGYTNLGHFAAAYRKRFGCSPRDMRRQARLASDVTNSATG